MIPASNTTPALTQVVVVKPSEKTSSVRVQSISCIDQLKIINVHVLNEWKKL